MRNRKCIIALILAMASLPLSIPSFSQDKDLLAKADSLYKQGRYLYDKEFYEEAINYLEEAAGIRRDQLGDYSAGLGNCLSYIGLSFGNLGDYEQALDYHQRALAIREKIYGREHSSYATSLSNIGVCFGHLSDYAKALAYLQQALIIREKIYGKEHSSYAKSLSLVGNCYNSLGDYAKALEYHQQALAIREKIYGKEHSSYANSLLNIGDVYKKLSYYSKALECCQQALAIREKIYGKEHSYYATSLDDTGECYGLLGDNVKALEYHQLALAINEKVLGKDHPAYATSLSNIGSCYSDLGDNVKAIEYHKQALEIRVKRYGLEHPACATNLNNIGGCYHSLGDYVKALEYYQKARVVLEKVYGTMHPRYATILSLIGNNYAALGETTKALECHQKVLAIREQILGKESPDYGTTLCNIGSCYIDLSEYNKALECIQQALAIDEKTFGKGHPNYAITLSWIGICYYYLADLTKALEYLQQALAIREKLFEKEDPRIATNLRNIGVCYADLGDHTKASEFFLAYTNMVSSIVVQSFSTMTESQRASFWNKYNRFFTNRLFDYSTSISSPEMNRTAYDGALLGKGLLLNAEMEMRKLILESRDEEALGLYNEIKESRVRLDKLYEDPVGKKDAIDSLNNDIDTRQLELMKRSKVFGDYTRNLALKWTDVQGSLGKKDIAIEFETYTHKDTTFYIALTLRPSYTEPHLVELFNSEELKGVRARYDKETGMRDFYSSHSLTKLFWGKLSSELTGVKNVYFSPAGELNNIGIEYLLDEDGNHLVSEKRNYYRLTSTRELVKERKSSKMASATVYGGIRYDITPESRLTGEESESERLASTATRSWLPMGELSRARWEYLPGTKEEADAISSTLFSRKVHNDLIEGEASTEESFKALSGAKNDVIHIATHGFYWTETEATAGDVETSSFALDGQHNAPKEDKALTRSGLLFAGAQNTFEGKDIPIDVEDGILTAKDISRMDLRDTELAVLSACQSGLGEVTGDGVFGLQRGFKKAGVQSLVMSLWKVSDEATMIMMTRFYENLAKGRSKYNSFREAQNYLRKYDDGIFDEPQYYAAFVLLDAIR